MGRNRTFDEAEVIDKAVGRFWAHGYKATSVRDLGKAMGMTSASLYNAFGGKKSLFKRSLQHYLDRSSRRRIAMLDASSDPRGAIEDFLKVIVTSSSSSRDGCLLVNSAAEIAAHDGDIGEAVAEGLKEVEDALARAVARGQEAGTVSSRFDPATFARTLLGTVVSIRVMSRTPLAGSYLHALAESQIEMLRPEWTEASKVGPASGSDPRN